MEGIDVRAARRVWEDLAESEERLEMMHELGHLGIGFTELERFHLKLIDKLKSESMRAKGEKVTRSMVKAAMKMKIKDEKRKHEEMDSKRKRMRMDMKEKLIENSKPYRALMKKLRDFAYRAKGRVKLKYKKKLKKWIARERK